MRKHLIMANITSLHSPEPHNIPKEFLIFAQIYIVLVIAIGVPGNLLTVVVICSRKNLHTLSNLFILHLSVTDLAYMAGILPMRFATFYFQAWLWSETACNVFAAMGHFLYGISIYTLVCIALHRVLSVVHQNVGKALSTKRALAVQFGTIYISTTFLAVVLPVAGIWGHYEFYKDILSCTFSLQTDPDYKYLLLSFGVWIPFVFIIICYIRIFAHVRLSHKKIEAWTRRESLNSNLTVNFNHQINAKQEEVMDADRASEQSDTDSKPSTSESNCLKLPVIDDTSSRTSSSPVFIGQSDSVNGLMKLSPSNLMTAWAQRSHNNGLSHAWVEAEHPEDSQREEIPNRLTLDDARLVQIQEISESNTSNEPAISFIPQYQSKEGSVVPQLRSRLCSGDSVQSTSHENLKSTGNLHVGATFQQQRPSLTSQNSSRSKKSVTFGPRLVIPGNSSTQNEVHTQQGILPQVNDENLPSPTMTTDTSFFQRSPSIFQRNRRQAIRLSITMVCTFCVFLMCTLPYFVVNVSTTIIQHPEAYLASLIISWLSSCLNPIVYVVVNPQFRHAYGKVLGKFAC